MKDRPYAAVSSAAGSSAAGSKVDLFEKGLFNHDVEVTGGVLAERSAALLGDFFRKKRKKNG